MAKLGRWSCLTVLSFLIVQCGSDDKGGNGNGPDPIYENVNLTLYTAAPLPAGLSYELWALPKPMQITAELEDWVSLGRFNVRLIDDMIQMVDVSGTDIANNDLNGLGIDLTEFDSLFVTVEPVPDADTLASGVVYLRGGISVPSSQTASLGFPGTGLANLDDNAVASFVTPTDSDTSNELSGLWFTSGDLNPSLFGLPLPPDGWIYEGWAIHEGVPISTGRFADYTMPDDMNPFSSDELPAPSAPGEDFLDSDSLVYGFSLPITFGPNDDAVVTVEPDADWDPPGPFPYKIYVGQGNQDPTVGQPYQLDALDNSIEDNAFPNAIALISKPTDESR